MYSISIEELGVVYKPNGFLQKEKYVEKYYKELYDRVLAETSFLNEPKFIERIFAIKNNIYSRPICPVCGKDKGFKFSRYVCSVKCANADPLKKDKVLETNIKKYGGPGPSNPEIRDKTKKTNLERYGVDNPAKSQVVKEKFKKTCLDKYGVEWPIQNKDVQKKMQETNIEKYGVPYPLQLEEKRILAVQTNIRKYRVKHPILLDSVRIKTMNTKLQRYGSPYGGLFKHISEDVVNLLHDKSWVESKYEELKDGNKLAEELGISYGVVLRWLSKHNIEPIHEKKKRIVEQDRITSFIESLGFKVKPNDRSVIHPLELDILIPSKDIAIEYNGLYWHSMAFQKDKNYHITKLKKCNEAGVRLITLFEDEWIYQQDLVKNKIKNILGISEGSSVGARKCKIIQVSPQSKKEFLDRYHIQGDGSGSITYGLEHENELVAVMTFIANENNSYELNRYATSITVQGGFNKLLSYFKKNHRWVRIKSFADLRWSEGSVYERSGFILEKVTPPDYYYVVGNRRYHKFGFRHTTGLKKLHMYDPNLSEMINMENHGIYPIYNCGLQRWVMYNNVEGSVDV
jgi:transposase-like protein